MSTSFDFPKYAMMVDGHLRILTFRDAYVMYDSGWHRVSFGDFVLESDLNVRDMTDADREDISEAADEYSASK